ncbi:hypothetical protein [Ruminococcus albus]|uniref:hypothetical protein n=1 Tax=Ruminococcus albus TaxID=1264 RepID=UPI001D1346D1|nr:hypothetical protein [Ruminococcus albus]MCC3352868.1 hypothetical protein [Ruminococcus albus 8]
MKNWSLHSCLAVHIDRKPFTVQDGNFPEYKLSCNEAVSYSTKHMQALNGGLALLEDLITAQVSEG